MANLTRNHVFVDLAFNFNTSRNILLARVVNNDWNYMRLSTASSPIPNQDVEKKSVMSKAMEAYMKRYEEYESFIKQQVDEFQKGKQFLAKIMGENPDNYSQEEIDRAIEYLFPSGLFETKARPQMKDPKLLFKKLQEAQIDHTGRPHHYLHYTTKPKFTELMHECAELLENLNEKYRNLPKGAQPPKNLYLELSTWISKENLEKKFEEKLLDVEYVKFVESMELLAGHPFSSDASEVIEEYSSVPLQKKKSSFSPIIVKEEDGKTSITIEK